MVKMIREDGKTADVHPAMIEEYIKGGYKVAEEPKPKPRARKKVED